jgi:hypothetical protein
MRRWLARLGLIGVLYAPLLALVPAPAYAGSSNTCITSDTLGCVKLIVNITPAPASNATITVKREGTSGTDDNFTLNPVSLTQYTSGGVIWDTAGSTTTCSTLPFPPNAYFDITVSGSAVGSAQHVNMCPGAGPPVDGSMTKTISITVAPTGGGGGGGGGGGPTGPGGVKGHIQIHTVGGPTIDCPAGSGVYIDGPTKKQVQVGSGGVFDSGLTLTAGTYTVEIQCIYQNNPYNHTFSNVKVAAGQYTNLDFTIEMGNNAPPPVVDSGVDVPATCDAGPFFSWLICGLVEATVGAVDWIRDNIIVPFIAEKPLDMSDPAVQKMHTIWANMRNLASLFFILVFFMVIFGTAIGWDNYQIKKILPRLVVGALLVPLSWYICTAVIDVGYVLGQGLVALTHTIVPSAKIDFGNAWSILVAGGVLVGGTLAATAAISTLGAGVIISFLISLFAAFLTLVMRKILITTLVIISPFAFLLWILPNTQKTYNTWWQNFLKLVMMYPLIMGLFEAGRLFAYAAGTAPVNAVEKGVTPLIQMAALAGPIFMLPWTFSMAGKLMNSGRKLVARGAKFADKRYGKDSDSAHLREHHRVAVNAARSIDPSLNRWQRGLALKRSGLGSFRRGAGFAKTPPSLQEKINHAATAHIREEGVSDAQDRNREEIEATTGERIDRQTEAIVDKLKDAEVTRASQTTRNRNGIAVGNIDLDYASPEVQATIDASKATFYKEKTDKAHMEYIEQLEKGGGIDQLEAFIRREVLKGDGADHAVIAASLRRMSQSGGGFQRAQDLAMGSYVSYIGDDKKRHFAGGNGKNAMMGADGAVVWGPDALMGGSYDDYVDNKWRETWHRGTKNAPDMDKAKPLTSAAVDMSPEGLATSRWQQVDRFLAFYDQASRSGTDRQKKAARKGMRDFQAAAEGIIDTPVQGRMPSETGDAIASSFEMREPLISESAYQVLASHRTPEAAPPPRTVGAGLSKQIVAAMDHDLPRASQLHARIVAERGPDGAPGVTEQELVRLAESKGRLEEADLQAAGVAAARATAGAPPPALARRMAEQFSDHLDQLHEAERRYAADPKYAKSVEDAFLRNPKGKIPYIPKES